MDLNKEKKGQKGGGVLFHNSHEKMILPGLELHPFRNHYCVVLWKEREFYLLEIVTIDD